MSPEDAESLYYEQKEWEHAREIQREQEEQDAYLEELYALSDFAKTIYLTSEGKSEDERWFEVAKALHTMLS